MAANRFSGLVAIRSALANRNFRLYAVGNVLSHVGTWIQRVALGWLTWQLTESALWLGLVSMADLAPGLVLAPLAGALADRVDRLRALKFTQSLALLQAAVLAGLTATGTITPQILLGLSFFLGIVMAFNQPLRFAILPGLVPRKDLPAAISINSLSFNATRVIGPAFAGWIIVGWGIAPCFAINAFSYVAFIVAAFLMRDIADRPPARKPARDIPGEIADGVRYIRGHGGIGTLFVSIFFVAVFGRAYAELLPGFAAEVFGRGADGLAMLTSSLGAGAVVATATLAVRGTLEGLMRRVVRALMLLGIAVVALTRAPDIHLGMICVALAGYATVTCSVGQQTLLQSAIASEVRGRVMSLYGMIQRAGPAIGALLVGLAHDSFGLRWPVFVGGIMCLAAWLWLRLRRDRLAAILEAPPPESAAPAPR